MIVLIPTPAYDSVASRALTMEGVESLEVLCFTPTSYGSMFDYYWDLGKPFIVVEHDICPWPGLIAEFAECGSPWCTARYPLGVGNIALSFGIGKYVPDGPAPENWQTTTWEQLDGQVIPHLRKLYGSSHVHSPPVAHARQEVAA